MVEAMLDEKRKRTSQSGKVFSGNLILSKIQLQVRPSIFVLVRGHAGLAINKFSDSQRFSTQ